MSYAIYPPIPAGGAQTFIELDKVVEGLRQLEQDAIRQHMTVTHRGVVARLRDGSERDVDTAWWDPGGRCVGYYACIIFERGSRSGA